MKYASLLKRKSEIKAEIAGIYSKANEEDRELTDDESTEVASLKKSFDRIKSQIEQAEALNLEDDSESETKAIATQKVHENNYPGGPSPKKEFESISEFAAAVIKGTDPRLASCYTEYSNEQRMDTGSKGGFMVPTQLRPAIFELNAAEALVRPRAQVLEAGTPPDAEIDIPALDDEPDANGNSQVYAGVIVGKVAEGGLKPSTSFNLRVIKLQPQEIAALIPFTDKLLRNWKAASSWAETLLKAAVIGFEEFQFLRGNGVGGPVGIIYSNATIPVARQVSSAIRLKDFQNMLAVFNGDQNKAVWVISRSVFSGLLSLTGDGSGGTNIIRVDQSTGIMYIYGIPVRVHARVPGLGQKGDVGLYDFSEYLIKDGSGPILETGFATGQFENNKRSLKITWNVDGKSWRTKPFKGEDGIAVSHSVVLDVPSGS